jgi:hypothetical protein
MTGLVPKIMRIKMEKTNHPDHSKVAQIILLVAQILGIVLTLMLAQVVRDQEALLRDPEQPQAQDLLLGILLVQILAVALVAPRVVAMALEVVADLEEDQETEEVPVQELTPEQRREELGLELTKEGTYRTVERKVAPHRRKKSKK